MDYVPQKPLPTSGMAIASLVCGILGMFTCGLSALLGLGLGIGALVQTGRRDPQARGQGLAIAGTVISGSMVLLIPIMAAIMFPVFARARGAARETCCVSNLKQISMAAEMYRIDNNGHWPLKENWGDALMPLVDPGGNRRCFRCPSEDGQWGYDFNPQLSGMDERDVRAAGKFPAFYDGPDGWNAGAPPRDIDYRHQFRSAVIAFADGTVARCDSKGTRLGPASPSANMPTK